MSIYKRFARTENETKGILLQLDDCAFRVLRAGGNNLKFDLEIARHQRELKLVDMKTEAGREKLVKSLADLLVNAIVIDWVDVKDREGKPLAFTKENAKSLFIELPDLAQLILLYASDQENFTDDLKKEQEEAKGIDSLKK